MSVISVMLATLFLWAGMYYEIAFWDWLENPPTQIELFVLSFWFLGASVMLQLDDFREQMRKNDDG